MNWSRREVVVSALALAAGASMSSGVARATMRARAPEPEGDDTDIKPASTKLKLLILGGTSFTGPHLVRLALKRGHSVTVFNRGKTEKRIGPLPEGVERLVGDRDLKVGEGLKALEGDRTWDSVIDTSTQFPKQVRASSELLAKRVKQYIYVSSISAYKAPFEGGADESAPLAELAIPNEDDLGPSFENYGGLKALCEKAAESALPGRVANVRPTFIVGPGDPTDRFTFWPVRLALREGQCLCPGDGLDPIQFIDSRDLAAFYLHLAETGGVGVFNAAGPKGTYTTKDLVETCLKQAKGKTEAVWAPLEFLQEQGLLEDGSFTVFVPRVSPMSGMAGVKIDRALKAGLKLRPVADTVRDTLTWWPTEVERRIRVGKELVEQAKKEGKPEPKLGDPLKLRAGIDEAKEKAAIEKWLAQGK